MANAEHLPKPIRRALNQIAHCRALMHQSRERLRLASEIDRLLAEGLTAEEALEHLRNNPPITDPGY